MRSNIKEDDPDTYLDHTDRGCLMYPVFCAVEIPSDKLSVLDEIVLSSRRGLVRICGKPDPEDPVAAASLIFMDSEVSGTVIECGSHVPLRPFPSYPRAGKSLQQIHDEFRRMADELLARADGERSRVRFAIHNFAVVDSRTLKDGTMLLCSDSRVEIEGEGKKALGLDGAIDSVPEGLATLRVDGFSSLINMVPDEMGTGTLLYNEPKDSFVFTEEFERFDHMNYVAKIQAKIARGEPLREIEERTSGLRDPGNGVGTDSP